jgi:hypothetical protein
MIDAKIYNGDCLIEYIEATFYVDPIFLVAG